MDKFRWADIIGDLLDPWGDPKGPRQGPLKVQRGALKKLMISGMLGINSTQFLAVKINTRSPKLQGFILGAHGVSHGRPGSYGGL